MVSSQIFRWKLQVDGGKPGGHAGGPGRKTPIRPVGTWRGGSTVSLCWHQEVWKLQWYQAGSQLLVTCGTKEMGCWLTHKWWLMMWHQDSHDFHWFWLIIWHALLLEIYMRHGGLNIFQRYTLEDNLQYQYMFQRQSTLCRNIEASCWSNNCRENGTSSPGPQILEAILCQQLWRRETLGEPISY